MKKKVLAATALAAAAIAGLGAALAAAGSSSDPFVSQDYLTGAYYAETKAALLQQVQTAAAETEQDALGKLDTLANAYLARAGAGESADGFLRLTLSRGDRLNLPTGASFVLQSGHGVLTVAVGTLVDVTDGSTVADGGQLTSGHHYVAAERSACSFTVRSATAVLSVQGAYVLDQADVAPLPFTDVPADIWYTDAVDWAVVNGITVGATATTFEPEETCTRAQIVTFLYRAAGEPDVNVNGAAKFTDVNLNEYYAAPVAWAVQNGITVGTTATTFSPEEECTRAQIVTFLHRYEGEPAADASNVFTDVAQGEYYAPAVNWAVQNGITVGTTSTTFSPEEGCTRAQIVTFLYRDLA